MNRSGIKISRYGIQFDSLLELDIYEEFLSRGIQLKRGEPIKVFEPFNTSIICYSNDNKKFVFKQESSSIRGIEYTPDFILNNNIYIELKGFANETFRYRWKLFKQYITENKPDSKIFLVKRRHNGRIKQKDNEARIIETKQIVDNIIKLSKNGK